MNELLLALEHENIKLPEVDLTITISVVIAVCAIISPVITTLLNNRHLYKMKRLDIELEYEKASAFYRRGVFENYLKATGEVILTKGETGMQSYGAAYPLALLYFPDELRPDLEKINESIYGNFWEEALDSLNCIAPKIHAIVQTM